MNTPVPGWERVTSRQPVHIPTADGKGIAETLWVDVPAWKSLKSGQMFLENEARSKIERIKARHLGLLTPEELRFLRQERFDLTQKEMSELLQIGHKSYTRWESGRERPSRSMNILLCALRDGQIDVNYLRSLRGLPTRKSWAAMWRESLLGWTARRGKEEGAGQPLLSALLNKSFSWSFVHHGSQEVFGSILESASRHQFRLPASRHSMAVPQPRQPIRTQNIQVVDFYSESLDDAEGGS